MAKGVSRQSVHPMEMTKNGQSGAPVDDDDSQRGTDNSSEHIMDDNAAEFRGAPTEIPSSEDIHAASSNSSRAGSYQDKPIHHSSENSSNAVIPSDLSESDDPPIWRGQPKPGRRLTFADETGGVLVEISYSNKTHYSKQAGPSAIGGTGRACCVIS